MVPLALTTLLTCVQHLCDTSREITYIVGAHLHYEPLAATMLTLTLAPIPCSDPATAPVRPHHHLQAKPNPCKVRNIIGYPPY